MKNLIKAFINWDQKSWNTENIKAWEEQRANGKWRYILKFGCLWGLMMIAGITLFEFLLNIKTGIEIFWLRNLIFLSIGLFNGVIMWKIGESKYQNYLAENFSTKADGFPVNDALVNKAENLSAGKR